MKHLANRALALLLAVLLAVGTLLVPAAAASGDYAMSLSTETVAPGETAEMTLRFTTASASRSIAVDLDWDADGITFDAETGVDAGDCLVDTDAAYRNGFELFRDEAKTPFAAGSYTVKLKLRVAADTAPGDYEIFFDTADICDETGATPWNVETTGGKIIVAEKAEESLLHGGETLEKGGSYTLADDAAGIITVATTEPVTVSGSGVAWDSSYSYTADTVKYANLKLDCSKASGAQLTLKDMFLEDRADTSPLVNFAGTGNRLNFEGTVVMDKYGQGQGTYAAIHVPQDAELTIGGAGTLYLYKTSGGSGIGGNKGEMNGTIVFAMTGTAFIKGTKQGAVIGVGTGAKGTGLPGTVTFRSGEYNLISNSRGAVIGGSAGGDGASEGTEVRFEGGTVSINTDYSGSSVGGGGYAEGNDSSGGTVILTGGSLRIYVDKNAAKNVGQSGFYKGLPMPEGVNNVSMTAERKNAAGEDVYLCIVDTKGVEPDANGQYTVTVDGKKYYTGGLHDYGFVQEGLDKGEQLSLTSTVSNWYRNGETRLFVYLTGEAHTIQVNDAEAYQVSFDNAAIGTIAECNGEIFSAAAADHIELDKTELRLSAAGEAAQLTATATAGLSVKWESSDETIARVDQNGLVTAVANGVATITATAGEASAKCTVLVGACPVFFFPKQENAVVTVSDYVTNFPVYPYASGEENGYVVVLTPGAYTYTVTASGYYGSTCGFTVNADGTVKFTTSWSNTVLTQYGLTDLLDGAKATFRPELEVFTKSANAGAWDGVTLDVSWFDPANTTHTISTPAQLAGLAAIVNGIYNNEIEGIIDYDANGVLTRFTPESYDALATAKIKARCTSGNATSGGAGLNQVTSNDYYFSALGYDFDGQTVKLAADLDMGGYQDENGNWTGARYMTIGGQSQMHYVKTGIADGYSHLGASFNGTFDGQGHLVYNIYCNRYSVTAYGDSATIGLIGRLGIHDSDYSTWKKQGTGGGNYPPVNPTVRNVAVAGYFYGRCSVGAIVGKTGHTAKNDLGDGSVGAIIENCVNFATVHNTDSKGVGGIVGASWNGGVIRNCVNFGKIYSSYGCPTGGIAGSNENAIVNSYNMGEVSNTSGKNSYAMAIGTNNGGGTDVRNCYWLTGSAPGGGYYGSVNDKTQIVEITDNYNETTLTAAQFMQNEKFVTLLNGKDSRVFKQAATTDAIYTHLNAAGYAGAPVPRIFCADTSTLTKIEKVSDPDKLTYVEGERFDPTGLDVRAYWSDGTEEKLEDYTYSIDRTFELGDTEITVNVKAGSMVSSYTFKITVIPVSLDSLKIKTQPTRRAYNEGDTFDPDGLKVEIHYTNGTTATAVWSDGKFADSEDETKTYDIRLVGVDAPLTAEQDGKPVVVSYTFTDGVTRTADTAELTVIPAANKPKQDDNGYYLVGTPAELDWIAAQVNNGIEPDLKARLTADITASEAFEPIGSSISTKRFKGILDGDGHRVTLNLVRDKNNTALIGYSDSATIRNVITAGTVTAAGNRMYVAALVGQAENNTLIENCGNEAAVTCGGTPVGGLVGSAAGTTTIRGCYNWGVVDGTATSNKAVGGIAGEVKAAGCKVENCYNWGSITGGSGTMYGVGGIIGKVSAKATVTNVYNAGTITNRYTLYGNQDKYATAIIGNVSSTNAQNVSNYYWLEGSSVNALGSSSPTAENKLTAEELKAAAEKLGDAFKTNANGYPLLKWQPDGAHEHSWGEWTVVKKPTCMETGTEERVCSVGGEKETRELAMTPHTDADHDYKCDDCGAVLKEEPKLTYGEGQTWTKGTQKELTFVSDADLEDFLTVMVDGSETKEYALGEKTTQVTLKAAYLETLSVGKHTLRIVSRNGAVEVEFEILAAKPASPATGDAGMPMLYATLAVAALAGMLFLLRKKQYRAK